MKTIISSLAVLAFTGAIGSAAAQDHNPAVKDSTAAHVEHAADGANSFTEDQAKGRIEKSGFSDVMDLKKDNNGHWIGWATKGGKKVHIALDYKGNITTLADKK